MEFPPGIHTGDGGGFDMQISNKVHFCHSSNCYNYGW